MMTSHPRLFSRLIPPGTIRPAGWLRTVVEEFAAATPGNLDLFWPDVRDNRWFGGTDAKWAARKQFCDHGDNEAVGFERAPYWLDGAIPLSMISHNTKLKRRVTKYVNFILEHQQPDGLLGPQWSKALGNDAGLTVFSQALAIKALIQWHAATQDIRVPDAVKNALRFIFQGIQSVPLHEWSKYRWFEILQGLIWLMETAEPESWMVQFAQQIQEQGFDWTEFLLSDEAPVKKASSWTLEEHVVNVAMQLREPLLVSLAGLPCTMAPEKAVSSVWKFLDQYHGQPTGMFTGDECLAGTDPSQGTELCAVVETMYSLEILMAGLLPDHTDLSDRLEKIAFNALPAQFSKDWNLHQYDQQVNQIECSLLNDRCWTTNSGDANLFGLQPNYGCCTANMAQGWAKFVSHLWLREEDEDQMILTALSLAPCEFTLPMADGGTVSVRVSGEYPFRTTPSIEVRAPENRKILLRIPVPAWAESPVCFCDKQPEQPLIPGKYFVITKPMEQEILRIDLNLPRSPQKHRHTGGGYYLTAGPLLLCVPIASRETPLPANTQLPTPRWPEPRDRQFFADTGTEWNRVPCHQLLKAELVEHPISEHNVFANVPLSMESQVAAVRNWTKAAGSAGPIPQEPDFSEETSVCRMIPYGCTTLRLTVFPSLKD